MAGLPTAESIKKFASMVGTNHLVQEIQFIELLYTDIT